VYAAAVKRRRKLAIAMTLAILVLVVVGVRFDRDPVVLEARWATPPSKFIDVGGARVHYRDRGPRDGAAILLIHGSSSNLFTWEGWVERLVGSHRVVTLDMPGHGLTGPDPKERYGASEMAAFVDDFVTAVGLERFVVAGNSMGGNVAWHYAIAHPDRVIALVLVDSAGLPRDEPRPFAFRMMASPVLGHVVRWVTPHALVASSVRDVYGDPSRIGDGVVERYEDLLLRSGNREAARVRMSRPDDGLAARLGEIHVPTLILWGSKDRWILPKYGERLKNKIPNAKLVVLEGLGHVPMEEDPAASLAPVKEFLQWS